MEVLKAIAEPLTPSLSQVIKKPNLPGLETRCPSASKCWKWVPHSPAMCLLGPA